MANFHDDAGEVNWVEALSFSAVEGCAYMRISDGRCVLLDEEDLDLVSRIKWSAPDGYAKGRLGQCTRKTQGAPLYMHRLIFGVGPGEKINVDHRNRNTFDNRKQNLRRCDQQQNGGNAKAPKRSGSLSKHRGVSFRKSKHPAGRPWQVRGYVNYKVVRLGHFSTEIEAARAYNEWATIRYGEFALLNDV